MNIRVLVLVALITAFAPLSMDLFLPGLPDLRNDLGASDGAAHLTVTGCIVGLAIGQFVAGLLRERLGRKRPLMVGMIVWVLATIACAFAPNIALITTFRLVQGLGAGLAIALARTVIADLDPDRLAMHLSRMMLVLSVVPVLAPAIGGLALALTDWRGLFLALAAVGVVLLLVVRRFLPESRPTDADDPGAAGGLRQVLILGRKPAFLLPAVVSGAGFGVVFSYIGDSAFVFRDHYGMGPTSYGLLFGANACSLICGFQLGPILKRRWGTRRVMLVASSAGTVGGVAMVTTSVLFPTSVVPVVPPLMLILAAGGILIPLATAAAIDAHPQNVGGASGLSGALQFMLGGTLAALPVALQLGDGAASLGAACAACLVGAWLLVAVFLREPDDEIEPAVTPAMVPTVIPIRTDDVA
jgi:DHA1 family bicyclomycin/chloramphenicol resistance-like MFS transporter